MFILYNCYEKGFPIKQAYNNENKPPALISGHTIGKRRYFMSTIRTPRHISSKVRTWALVMRFYLELAEQWFVTQYKVITILKFAPYSRRLSKDDLLIWATVKCNISSITPSESVSGQLPWYQGESPSYTKFSGETGPAFDSRNDRSVLT